MHLVLGILALYTLPNLGSTHCHGYFANESGLETNKTAKSHTLENYALTMIEHGIVLLLPKCDFNLVITCWQEAPYVG